ncbi:MAG TPA: hypothetical protein PLR65_04100, partial [Anaerolineales bacterium]|nr:hypothetical protein [Anaerolineales bacterium]
MNAIKLSCQIILGGLSLLLLTSCAPQVPATPTIDVICTLAIEIAAQIQTQTAGAVTPTPIPHTATE